MRQDDKLEVKYPDITELELNEKLAREKEVLGVYVSGHPFEKYLIQNSRTAGNKV